MGSVTQILEPKGLTGRRINHQTRHLKMCLRQDRQKGHRNHLSMVVELALLEG